MSEKWADYTCSYRFDGSEWCVTIPARSHEEAEQRLKALSWGRVDGEIVARIPAWAATPGLMNWATRLLNWWRRK